MLAQDRTRLTVTAKKSKGEAVKKGRGAKKALTFLVE